MKERHWLRALALIAVLAMVGAACSEDTPTGGDNGTTEDPLGTVTLGEGEPITVAVIQSISGDTASLGTDQVRAVEIAVADRGGELLGHPIELQTEDDGCEASAGTTAAQRVVSDTQIVGVIGTSCSGAAVPAMEIFSPAGFTMISGSNTSPILTQAAGEEGIAHQDGYFRTAHNDQIQGAAAATFAFDELGVAKAATVHDGDPYTQGLADAFAKSFQELGGEITLGTAVTPGDTDMRPVLTEIAASGAELVFFPIFQPEADYIVQQAGEVEGLGDTAILMGADGLLSDTFVEDIPETEGMYFSGPATPNNLRYRDFVAKYETEYGEKPIQAFHAHSYDAMNILLDAIEAVAVEDGGTLTIGRGALRDEIAGTSEYEGLTGTLTCDEFGDCADPVIEVVQNTEAQESITDVKENVLFEYRA
jgi:branched-chain amino acid transport system substrate-binding protein